MAAQCTNKNVVFIGRRLKSNDAVKGEDHFLMCTKVGCCVVWQWVLVRRPSNIAAVGLNDGCVGHTSSSKSSQAAMHIEIRQENLNIFYHK